jgi:hypothetical protein
MPALLHIDASVRGLGIPSDRGDIHYEEMS